MTISVRLYQLYIKKHENKQSVNKSYGEDEFIHESMFYPTIKQLNITTAGNNMAPGFPGEFNL